MDRLSKTLLAAMLSSRGYLTNEVKSDRTGKGRKRTTTAAQQKRDKIKRKNKGK